MKNRTTFFVIILVIFIVFIAITGRSVISRILSNFLTNTQNGIERKTENSENTGDRKGKIPDGFPKDFPLYPSATPGGSAASEKNNAAKGHWLLLETNDATDKPVSYYSEQLEVKGWMIIDRMEGTDGTVFRVKKDKLEGNIIISQDLKSGKTTILIVLSPTNEGNPEPLDVGSDDAPLPDTMPE